MTVLKGTATLRITKEDSTLVPFCVEIIDLESSTGEEYEPHDEFDLLGTDTLPCPDAAYDLEGGESVTVDVEYELYYTTDYFGEVDCELSYARQEVKSNETNKTSKTDRGVVECTNRDRCCDGGVGIYYPRYISPPCGSSVREHRHHPDVHSLLNLPQLFLAEIFQQWCARYSDELGGKTIYFAVGLSSSL